MGVPYYKYGIMARKTLFYKGPYTTTIHGHQDCANDGDYHCDVDDAGDRDDDCCSIIPG